MKGRPALASLAAATLIGVAAPAFAGPSSDEPVATRPLASDPTGGQIADWIAADDAQPAPLGVRPGDGDVLPAERRIHGEVGAEVGNRGYGGYAAVQMPLGQASELDVAVAGDHSDYGRWGRGDRKAVQVALLLDGRDLKNLISRRNCNVPRWGVKLRHDPVVTADGSCLKPASEPAAR